MADYPIQCELITQFRSTTAGPAGSCGLDFWGSSAAASWVSKYLKAKPAILVLREEGRQAQIPLFIRRLPLGFQLASSYPYGRIEGDSTLLSKAAKEISVTLRRNRIIRAEISLTGEYADQLSISDLEASRSIQLMPPSVRHVLNLRHVIETPAELENIFNRKLRWAINRARRDGCQVEIARLDDAEKVQEIYALTMRAKGAPVNYGVDRFRGVLQDLAPLGLGSVLLGMFDGKPAGIAAFVDGSQSRHLLQLAVLPEAQTHRLSDLLIAECIQDAAKRGKIYFDFMASHAGDRGLMEFKEKWGSVAQPINNIVLPGMFGMGPFLKVARQANSRWGLFRAH